jgi:putative MATE family efflux protein
MSAAAPARKASPFDRSLIEGPISPAVWKLAWPTMLQNVVAGLQGIIDHALVGHLIGAEANAAIGVSWQIFLVVIVFMASLFSGQAVLVARFAGAGDADRVNRVVQQAFLTSLGMFVVLATIGYFASPALLDLVNASPQVKAQALPFLRISFIFSIGMLLFFMLSAALRAAGDTRTPLRLGLTMTVLNIILNVILIGGLGPIPALGTAGSALGTGIAASAVSIYALYHLFRGDCVVQFSRQMQWRPDWTIIKSLFKFGLPTGVQGIAMNVAGVLLLRFIGSLPESAAAQAAYAIGYGQLFSLITWTSVGLMGAAATIAGQNLGANQPDRAVQGVHTAGRLRPVAAAVIVGLRRAHRRGRGHRRGAAAVPGDLRLFHHPGARLHRRPARHGRHAQSPLHHARVADRDSHRALHGHSVGASADGDGYLDGHCSGALYPVCVERVAIPSGEVEGDQSGVGDGVRCGRGGGTKKEERRKKN